MPDVGSWSFGMTGVGSDGAARVAAVQVPRHASFRGRIYIAGVICDLENGFAFPAQLTAVLACLLGTV